MKKYMYLLAATSVERYIDRVDWRSKANVIKYRDAFRNKQSTDQTGGTKTSVVAASRQPEPENSTQEASSDTGTASSITTSEPGISPKGDELDSSSSKVTAGGGSLTNKNNALSESKTELGENKKPLVITDKIEKEQVMPSHSERMKDEPVTKVKDDKIEKEQAMPSQSEPMKDQPVTKVKDDKIEKEQAMPSHSEPMKDEPVTKVKDDKIEKEQAMPSHSEPMKDQPVTKVKDEVRKIENQIETGIDHTMSSQITDVAEHQKMIGNTTDSAQIKVSDVADRMGYSEPTEKEEIKTDDIDATDSVVFEQASVTDTAHEKAYAAEDSIKNVFIDGDKDMSTGDHSSKFTGDALSETDGQLGTNQQSSSKYEASENVDKQVNETDGKEDDRNLSKEADLVVKIDKQFSPKKLKLDTATEISSSVNASEIADRDERAENKIEKTEDKILETEMPTVATEDASKTKSETATVELSPTKEKPRAVGELQVNEHLPSTGARDETTEKDILPDKMDKDFVQEADAADKTQLEELPTEQTNTTLPDKILNESSEIASEIEPPSLVSDEKQTPQLALSKTELDSDLDENGTLKGNVELKHDVESEPTQRGINEENQMKTNIIENEIAVKDHDDQHSADNQPKGEIKAEKSDISLTEKDMEHQLSLSPGDSYGTAADMALADNQTILGDIKPAEDKSDVETVIYADPVNEKNQNKQTVSTDSFEFESKSNMDVVTDDKNNEQKHDMEHNINDVKTDSVEFPITTETESEAERIQLKATESPIVSGQLEADKTVQNESLKNDPVSKGTEITDESDILKNTDVKEQDQPNAEINTSNTEDKIKLASNAPKNSSQEETVLTSEPKAESPKSSKSDIEEVKDTPNVIEDIVSKESGPSLQKEADISNRDTAESPVRNQISVHEENIRQDTMSDKEAPNESEMNPKSDTQSQPITEPQAPKDENELSLHAETNSLQHIDEPQFPSKSTPQTEIAVKGPTDDEKQLQTSEPQPTKTVTEDVPPMTNGVLESPTEEAPDAVPGSSDGDGMLECCTCFSVLWTTSLFAVA